MNKSRSIVLVAAVVAASWSQASAVPQTKPGGYNLERDADVAKNEPGTHKGGGETIGYSFFAKAEGLKMVFRKRALKPGSGIGHPRPPSARRCSNARTRAIAAESVRVFSSCQVAVSLMR